MFVQGRDPLGRPSAGLGVGLALARTIVELHHGTLEAKSAGVGKGAEFIVCLPLMAEAAAVDSAPERKTGNERAPDDAAGPKYRVLVVDDNADAAVALSSLLRKHGHEILAINDGVEALKACEGFRPQIILLDVGMPGMSGLEIARRLRERNRSPRPLIIAVTGWAKPEDEARSREAGFDLHLVKPVDESQLLEIIRSHSQQIR